MMVLVTVMQRFEAEQAMAPDLVLVEVPDDVTRDELITQLTSGPAPLTREEAERIADARADAEPPDQRITDPASPS